MWVDYRGSLSTVYNDGEISACGWIIEVHSVVYNDGEISACGWIIEVHSVVYNDGRSQHVGRLYRSTEYSLQRWGDPKCGQTTIKIQSMNSVHSLVH